MREDMLASWHDSPRQLYDGIDITNAENFRAARR